MGWIARGWSGEEELWKVIWIYAALFIFLAKVADVMLRLTIGVDFDNPSPSQENTLDVGKILYGVWFFITAWRCAFNADWRIWGYIVRGLLMLFVLLFCVAYYKLHLVIDPFVLINKAINFAEAWAGVVK